ncbi:MAG: hypothetical protein HOO93_02345 [Methyloglobulus sp.]|nr:hypothetical protein [Methyloglobulus sp.]
MTKNKRKIPDDDHVIRYVPWSRLRRDGNDEVIGILGEAFHLREKDKGRLSATWLEYFSNDCDTQLTKAVRVIRTGSLNVKSKSGFAIGNIRKIQATCMKYKSKIRIVHSPSRDNNAHVSVIGLPEDNSELFELLASEAWADLVLNKDIPD